MNSPIQINPAKKSKEKSVVNTQKAKQGKNLAGSLNNMIDIVQKKSIAKYASNLLHRWSIIDSDNVFLEIGFAFKSNQMNR